MSEIDDRAILETGFFAITAQLLRELAEARARQLQLDLDRLVQERNAERERADREEKERVLVFQAAKQHLERAERAEAELKRVAEDKNYLFRAEIGNEWEERYKGQQAMIGLRDEQITTLKDQVQMWSDRELAAIEILKGNAAILTINSGIGLLAHADKARQKIDTLTASLDLSVQHLLDERTLVCQQRDQALLERDAAEAALSQIRLCSFVEQMQTIATAALSPDGKQAFIAADLRARSAEVELDWIACASREEIEDMLKDSVCGDVDDMRRFIRERLAGDGKP